VLLRVVGVSAFWRVRTEGLTRRVQSVAGRDPTRSRFRKTTLFMCSPTVAPLWRGCKDIGSRGGGWGRTHLCGGERGCLPDRCRAPQWGGTPLHGAAEGGHAAVVELLLAAGAAVDAKETEVGGGGGGGLGGGGGGIGGLNLPLGICT